MSFFTPDTDCGCCSDVPPPECDGTFPPLCKCAPSAGYLEDLHQLTVIITGSSNPHDYVNGAFTLPAPAVVSLAGTYFVDGCDATQIWDGLDLVGLDTTTGLYVYYQSRLLLLHEGIATVEFLSKLITDASGTLAHPLQLSSGSISFPNYRQVVTQLAPEIEYCPEFFGNAGCTGTWVPNSDDVVGTPAANSHSNPNGYSVAASA